MIPPERLSELNRALEAAKPGPWTKMPYPDRCGWYIAAPPPPDRDWSADHVGYVFREADADLLALLRNLVPDLLAAYEEQRAATEAAIAAHQQTTLLLAAEARRVGELEAGIEKAERRIRVLARGLEPFAGAAGLFAPTEPDFGEDALLVDGNDEAGIWRGVSIGDLRRARTLLPEAPHAP